jgi:hypothetical protein
MDTQTVEVKHKAGDLEQRKAELIRQGAFYRGGVVHAKAQIKHAVRPEALFHSAVDHAAWALRSRVDGLLKPTGTSVAMLMPYAVAVFKFIRQRRMGKAGLGMALALAAAGWYLQQRRARQLAY